MYEFHCWAALGYHTYEIEDVPQQTLLAELRRYLDGINRSSSLWTLRSYNGVESFQISGQHNHRSDYVIDIFRWIAEHGPGSYGLLYVSDDEDAHHSEVFRVWRLARGELTVHDDPFLSPRIPTLEDANGEDDQ